jgi:hypothetical protein
MATAFGLAAGASVEFCSLNRHVLASYVTERLLLPECTVVVRFEKCESPLRVHFCSECIPPNCLSLYYGELRDAYHKDLDPALIGHGLRVRYPMR